MPTQAERYDYWISRIQMYRDLIARKTDEARNATGAQRIAIGAARDRFHAGRRASFNMALRYAQPPIPNL